MARKGSDKNQGILTTSSAVGADDLERLRTGLESALIFDSEVFTVDLSHAEVLDGPCLAALMSVARTFASADRHLVLLVHPDVERSLSEWRLDSILEFTEAGPESKSTSSKGT